MKRSVPILLYHHVSPDREITPAGFERQLRSLLDQGYRSLSMTELVDSLAGRTPIDGKQFVVTFDDGYFDNWVYVFPILQKLAVKAMIYLVTERIESIAAPRLVKEYPDTRTAERAQGYFLSWAESRAMAASGLVEFGSHTHTHRHFVRKEKYADLAQELTLSKQLVEAELKRPCLHLAWPWGDYEDSWLPMVEKAGYETVVTTRAGANTNGTNPLVLKRFKVSKEDPNWLTGRLRLNTHALLAESYAFTYGWDRRMKNWLHPNSPYSHG